MSLTTLYNIKVNVIRVTKTADALGGWTEVNNVLHVNLPCRFNHKRGTEKIFFAKNSYFRDIKMYCAVVDIDRKDRVVYGSATYEVVDISNVGEMSRYMALDLKLIA